MAPNQGFNPIVSAADLASGKEKILPPEVIAGKKCDLYSINTGVATATYGGWKNILLLNKIKSPGGEVSSLAVLVKTVPVDPAVFEIPQGYSLKL